MADQLYTLFTKLIKLLSVYIYKDRVRKNGWLYGRPNCALH